MDLLSALQPDAAQQLMDFLDVRSLCALLKCSRRMRIPSAALTAVWKASVTRRWNCRPNILATIGAADWKNAYEIMHMRHKHPRGAFFEKHAIVFAKGGVSGVYGWITLAHAVDARVHGTIELRVCVQNVLNDLATIALSDVRVLFNTHSQDTQNCSLSELRPTLLSAIARNGSKLPLDDGSPIIALHGSEFVVLRCRLHCPSDVRNEVDFLARAHSVRLSIVISNYRHHSACVETAKISLTILFNDEMAVWDHFVELPGGVVLLNTNAVDVI